jgi:AcrR family transcriptional regulator
MMARRSDTRERLIAAAVELIDARGVGRLRLREVAAAVGIQEPSIYKFFRDKDDLVTTASVVRYQRGLIDLTKVFVRRVESSRTASEFTQAIDDTIRDAYVEERALYRSSRFDVLGMAQSQPELAALLLVAQHEADVLLASALRFAVARGWVRDDVDPLVLAHWAFSLINGRIFVELDPSRSSAAQWDRLTIDAIIQGLTGPAGEHG